MSSQSSSTPVDRINRPSREDIHNRVLELTNPAKYAEQQAKEAQRKDASADATAVENSGIPLTKAYCNLLRSIVGRTLPA